MKIILFGVGGVGSWCAEALVRSGIEHLTIVDYDTVDESNINRQLMATTKTVGLVKVEVMKERLLDINPNADITAIREWYNEDTATKYNFDEYDYVIDAIDSLKDKALLILNACNSKATLISSMGAAGKKNPQMVKVAEFWKVKTCPLARALRQRFKKSKTFPSKKFKAVYSEELNNDNNTTLSTSPAKPKAFIQVTASFGLNLAAEIINKINSEQSLTL